MKTYEVVFDLLEDGVWESKTIFLALDPKSNESLTTQAYKIVSSVSKNSGFVFNSSSIDVITEEDENM